MARINGIQNGIYLQETFLVRLEVGLQKEYQGLSDMETIYWK